ncbi:hypothetical protein CgunFtcFv8_022931 [Champsocephalus gunnari]|uniref:Helicase C-terminal domain-containing protein n=1 Tax=Champsocephalus gunnari TaxID=52237 RepID=A0AAN8HKY0_CHAGU|nr:hypothetical protein CgunFtcFv8_022931 [Champsocephalus gunnari]
MRCGGTSFLMFSGLCLKKEELTLEGLKQFYINVEQEEWKLDTPCDLYENLTITQGVIFQEKSGLAEKMHARDFTVSALHGDMDQKERDVMRVFRSGSSRVLITTDLLARGIDVQQVSLVINYKLRTTSIELDAVVVFTEKELPSTLSQRKTRGFSEISRRFTILPEEMPMNVADLI